VQPQKDIEADLSVEPSDDVEAHLVKEALAVGAVAGALFAGTTQARAAERGPNAPNVAAQAHVSRAAAVIFDGGTANERTQVTRALAASSFDWTILPPVTVHIGSFVGSASTRGNIWLEASLLHSGTFAWGVIQHEYAHQVDFFLLDDAERAQLLQLLGGTAWCVDDVPGLRHADYACERFASTLAWAYWQSPDNCMKPTGRGDVESGLVAPAVFRAVLAQLLS
jgi:hypothetical protein